MSDNEKTADPSFTTEQIDWISKFSADMYRKGVNTIIEDCQKIFNQILTGLPMGTIKIHQDIHNFLQQYKHSAEEI